MMKTRIIQTRYWNDNFISESNYLTRYLYLYLLTSQYINICGIFQLPINKILFETGITRKQFTVAQKELDIAKKVLFLDGWVYVSNARKNNKYENSPLNVTCCENELSKVPKVVMDGINIYLNSSIDSSIDSTMYSTHKSKIINNNNNNNNNIETINKYNTLDSANNEELINKLAKHYNVNTLDIRKTYDLMYLWCKSKGKTYKDYRAGLMNWTARRIEEGKIKCL